MWTVKIIFILACFAIAAYPASNDDTITLEGVIYDEAPNWFNNNKNGWSAGDANRGLGFSGTDFELPTDSYSNSERGLVGNECNASIPVSRRGTCGTLGADSTPTYAYSGRSPWGNIQSPASFYNWFHLTSQTRVVNISIPLKKVDGQDVYQYQNNSFFPVDGKGWKDRATDGHNYAFCMVAHGRFVYKGKEVFNFYGDDDVWVYINNYLVIDLGALHTQEKDSVSLDAVANLINITVGNRYRIDFFYCERHTTASNFMATTSIDISCDSYDRCNVCEGDGQSCCTPADLLSCSDGNACTIERCGVTTKCVSGGTVQCPASDKCTTWSCDPKQGCVSSPVVCANASKCLNATCDLKNGCSQPVNLCDDNKACTQDVCNENNATCSHYPQVCVTTDKCKTATVDSNGCCQIVDKCPQDTSNPCMENSCNATTGVCSSASACKDIDKCVTAVSCAKSATGPSCAFNNQTKDCAAKSTACVTVSCSLTTGGCVSVNTNCTASSKCNIPSCDVTKKGCIETAKDCSSNTLNKCFLGKCNATDGNCYTSPVVCSNTNKCILNTCNNLTGICEPKNLADDNNVCTNDTCNVSTGIITHLNISCDDRNPCTIDQCDPVGGCYRTPRVCNDLNSCTRDSCNASSTAADPCVYAQIANCTACKYANGTDLPCQAQDLCFPALCDPVNHKCTNDTVNCNDNNVCTIDKCLNGGCDNSVQRDCSLPDKCQIPSCDPVKGCSYTKKSCDSGDPCTPGTCNSATGQCSYTTTPNCIACGNNACVTTDVCTPRQCNANTSSCVDAPISCDDGNPCTIDDPCNNSGAQPVCKHTPNLCSNSISLDSCNPYKCLPVGGCQIVPVVCDAPNLCSVPVCNNMTGTALCQVKPKDCSTDNPCIPKVCNLTTGACDAAPVVCPDDGNPCTIEKCVSANGTYSCTVELADCGTDQCGAKVCNPTNGLCETATLDCNDGNPCTADNYTCSNSSVFCSFTDSNLCDDNNACTLDSCDSSNQTHPCSNTPLTCSPRNMCETVAATCNNVTGCAYTPVYCPGQDDVCKVTSCDDRIGCRIDDKYCSTRDDNCFVGVCDSTQPDGKQCSEARRDGFDSRTSGGVLCALLYDDTAKKIAIGTGAAVGIAIGAAAAVGIAGYGGKKGYDHWKNMQNQRFEGVQNNPLYEQSAGASDNPLYRNSVAI